MSSCGCPDAVIFHLRSRVQRELEKVRAIKRSTGLFDSATSEVIGLAGGDIDTAVGLIPAASPVDFLDLLAYLTCPLTPLAVGLGITDLQDLDPTIALNKVSELRGSEVESARSNYEGSLRRSTNANLIKIARKYVSELLRIRFDANTFAEAVLISATVLAVCGTSEYNSGPYAAFALEIQDFSFQNGVPSTLSQNAAAVVQKLLRAEQKFKELREALS